MVLRCGPWCTQPSGLVLGAASLHSHSLEGQLGKTGPIAPQVPGSLGLQAARIQEPVPKQGLQCAVWLLRESWRLPLEKQQLCALWLWGRDEEQAAHATSFS